MNRRTLLLTALGASFAGAEELTPDHRTEVFNAVWQGAKDRFYDPQMRGIDWDLTRRVFLPRASVCVNGTQLLTVLREMLSTLHNSHIFLYSPEEWALRENILPFCFERRDGHVFVFWAKAPFAFGDEVVAVDGIPAGNLRVVTLAQLEPVMGNPNFGAPDSHASMTIRRRGVIRTIDAVRVMRTTGFTRSALEFPRPDVAHLRMFTLSSSDFPPSEITGLWSQITEARALILDLRNCVGGDSKISNFIAGSLLGAGRRLFTTIPRTGSSQSPVTDMSDPDVPRMRGRVALIVNSNTESQPEALAAICKEYGCARLFGERTAGAFNGWTEAIPLPGRFARFAVPYTRSVSPLGVEYEGRGVEPDEAVFNTSADFHAKHDRVLAAALRYIGRSR